MTLNKNQLIYLWVGLGLFLMAFIWDGYLSNTKNIERYKSSIESYVHKNEKKANTVFEDKNLIKNLIDENVSPASKLFLTKKIREEGISFTLFRETELIFWTQTDVVPYWSHFTDSSANKTIASFVKIADSQYELCYRNTQDESSRRVVIAFLIPIKKMYPSFEGKYLKSHFPASDLIPFNLEITEAKQKNSINTSTGKILCYISNEGTEMDLLHDWGMVLFLCLGFLMIGIVGDKIAKQMLSQYPSPLIGVLFFVSIFALLRLCILWIQESKLLDFMNEGMGTFYGTTFIKSLPAFL